MTTFRTTTDVAEAERLYNQFYPKPSCLLHSWDVRHSLLDPPDIPYFLHTDSSLLPLQIAVTIGSIEWFGGYLIEDNPWLVTSAEEALSLLSVVSPFSHMLDAVSYLRGVTVPSRLPIYKMSMPSSWDSWIAALNKKRRWELRQAERVTTVELVDHVSEDLAERLAVQGAQLSIESWNQRGKSSESYYKVPHFIRCLISLTRTLARKGVLQAAVRRSDSGVVGVALGFPDTNEEYVWLLSAADITVSASLGKALLADIVHLASATNKKVINACADDVGKLSVKYQMGFRPRPTWTVATSYSSLPNSEGLDPRISWLEELVDLYAPDAREQVLSAGDEAFYLLANIVDERERRCE